MAIDNINELPAFSVVICNYNYAQFVGDAITSALAQDYPAEKVEVIVVHDGSTDDSRCAYARIANDPRCQLVLQENRGQSAAFEAGVRRATGDYVCLLDADDTYLPNKLARVAARIAALNLAPDTLFLCHDLVIDNFQEGAPVRLPQTWFDRQDKTAQERMLALQYLRGREHLVRRLSATHRLSAPTVAITVRGAPDSDQARDAVSASLQSHDAVTITCAAPDDDTELMRLARAWAQQDAEYMVFMRAGDRLDRTFVEGHLFLRQHGALVAASCSDIRLIGPQDSLVHADVFGNSGAWKHPVQQVPPLATGLRDWVVPPCRPACSGAARCSSACLPTPRARLRRCRPRGSGC